MGTFSAEFLGCKISQCDLEVLRAGLLHEGLAEVAEAGDVHVVNGCCVTASATAKTRSAVRRALGDGAGHVVVTGCAARLTGADVGAVSGRVSLVDRPSEGTETAVTELVAALGCRGGAPQPWQARRTRAFLKVQDGCSFSCAFCVIPLVRGPTRSRPVQEVVAEAGRRVAAGQREVVLGGVNLGLYRDRSAAVRLPQLVEAVASVDGVERLRLSSIEVDHLDDGLLATLARLPNVLPHLHVPLQSGDDAVLAAMRRRYDSRRYAERIAAARAAIGGLNVTADVIVGFPNEDEAAFAGTLALVEQVGLTGAHVFPYSPRPGTRTAGADPVTPLVKADRSARVVALASATGAAFRGARIGTRDEVLVEQVDDSGRATGYARDYTLWRVDAPCARRGDVVAAVASGVVGDQIMARSTVWERA